MAHLLHHLLTNSASRYPEKAAVIHKDGRISYRRLDKLSDQIADTLHQNGVQVGDRVGIYLPKSIQSVAAIFGIHKAGATYVPLDANAPAKRNAFIIQNCAIKAVFVTTKTYEKVHEHLSGLASIQAIVLVDDSDDLSSPPDGMNLIPWNQIETLDTNWQVPNQTENELAYILYTSGSTGDPKGVMISHRTSLTFVNWAHNEFQVTAEDRVSSHAPFHFDLSIFDLFSSIKAGATVVLIPPEYSVFPANLAKYIDEAEISCWYSVPSILTLLVQHGGLDKYEYKNLRLVLFAGEVFPTKFLSQLMGIWQKPAFYNLYGPTETNVCTYYHVTEAPNEDDPSIPIGIDCRNYVSYVLDEEGQPVPDDEVGELVVRGPGVANGYWGNPERTAQSFTQVPTEAGELEKAYKTGDLVKKDEQGNYVFLGRRDHQIKSRGYRIEIGEIEAALHSHPDIKEAVIIPIPDDIISNKIIAVVVVGDQEMTTRKALEGHCANRIPQYMMPHRFDFMAALPKTSTGKIDRTKLRQDMIEATKK